MEGSYPTVWFTARIWNPNVAIPKLSPGGELQHEGSVTYSRIGRAKTPEGGGSQSARVMQHAALLNEVSCGNVVLRCELNPENEKGPKWRG